MALKRINTEAEVNGFPITAIREVKILKALNHDNIVKLKEIVTSKGESFVQLKWNRDVLLPRELFGGSFSSCLSIDHTGYTQFNPPI